MRGRKNKPLPRIGWREWVGLASLSIPYIKAKIDTGAQTSALHAVRIVQFKRNGEAWVRFDVHPFPKNSKETVHCEAPVIEEVKVKSSNGKTQIRPKILSSIRIGNEVFAVELTLTNRSLMGFPVLIGREALRKRYLVDVGASFVFGKPAFLEKTTKKTKKKAKKKSKKKTSRKAML